MRFLKMNKQATVTAKVPQLSGGTNLHEAANLIEDHQLTDSVNVWWHEAALRTRPGLALRQNGLLSMGATGAATYFVDRYLCSDRETLLTAWREPPQESSAGTYSAYSLDVEDGVTFLGWRVGVEASEPVSSFAVKAGKGANTAHYFYLSTGEVLQQGEEPMDGAFRQLVDAEPYVPLVMINGKGVAYSAVDRGESGGVTYEGYNLLTDKFRCSYNTDGKSNRFFLPKGANTADYLLQINLTVYDTVKKTTRIIQSDTFTKEGHFHYPFTPTELGFTQSAYAQIDLLAHWDEESMSVFFTAQAYAKNGIINILDENTFKLPWLGESANNLEIIAWPQSSTGNRDTICKMKRCMWFGGDRSGVSGGSRLFVCGNPDKPNLVHWSDVNNPLYFPENNHAYIGGADQAVTGFGKQGELLVIFKEHELYAAQYVAGTDFTYEDVTSGKVTDVTAYMAQFPITPIHSAIGCDCPDTIRLVNNKLVWATSTGRVYMLPTVNQYNERNVREVSTNVQARLEKESAEHLKSAVAGELQGYYLLLVHNTLYLMDADTSAFASFQYYASQERAQRNLPWYIWELDPGTDEWVTMVSDGHRVQLLKQPVYMPMYAETEWRLYGLDGTDDEGEPISCAFTTKLFDFQQMDAKKAIVGLYLGLTAETGRRARVSYVTDAYTAEDVYVLEGDDTPADCEAAGYQVRRLSPSVHRVSLFGVRVACEGNMAATGMTIQYKTQGVVR